MRQKSKKEKGDRPIIYGLGDPRDLAVHYIGMTTKGLKRGPQHKRPEERAVDTAKNSWLDDLFASGNDFTFIVLDEFPEASVPASAPCWWLEGRNVTELPNAEQWWIAYGRACGWPLTNANDGGGGQLNAHESTRAKMRAAKSTPEAIARSSAHGKSLWVRPGYREFMAEAGRTTTARAAKSAGAKTRLEDPEYKAAFLRGAAINGARPENIERMRALGLENAKKMVGENNPSKRPEVREKLRASATLQMTNDPRRRFDISDEIVFKLIACGVSHTQTADLLGVKRDVVRSRMANACKEIGMEHPVIVKPSSRNPRRSRIRVEDVDIFELYDAGWSSREIAERLGCKRATVRSRLHTRRQDPNYVPVTRTRLLTTEHVAERRARQRASHPQAGHGTIAMYRRRGCRCDICKPFGQAYAKAAKARARAKKWASGEILQGRGRRTPESIAKTSGINSVMRDPEVRARHLAAVNTPEALAKKSAKALRGDAHPMRRADVVAKVKATKTGGTGLYQLMRPDISDDIVFLLIASGVPQDQIGDLFGVPGRQLARGRLRRLRGTRS